MIGHFFMKYRRPLAYAVTKILADRIHRVIVPRRVYPSRLARASEPLKFSTHGSPKMEDWTTNRLAVTKEEKARCVHQIAMVLPRVEVPKVVEAKVERIESAYKPVIYKSAPWKPIHAAVKRNGGLRGSTATRWK
jgi:hypothetical protein